MNKNVILGISLVAIFLPVSIFWLEKKNTQEPLVQLAPIPNEKENEKIIRDLAELNNELVENVEIQIEQMTEHHIRGRVLFKNDPRKNGLFFATDAAFSNVGLPPGFDNLPSKEEMEIILNEASDTLDCDRAKGYSFPSPMVTDCSSNYRNVISNEIPSSWKLVAGNPDESCSGVKYSGNVKIRGWYEWRSQYVTKNWMFRVDNQDLSKLIPHLGKTYILENVTSELEEKLKNANSENPRTLTVKGIQYYCEGAPTLIL